MRPAAGLGLITASAFLVRSGWVDARYPLDAACTCAPKFILKVQALYCTSINLLARLSLPMHFMSSWPNTPQGCDATICKWLPVFLRVFSDKGIRYAEFVLLLNQQMMTSRPACPSSVKVRLPAHNRRLRETWKRHGYQSEGCMDVQCY